MKRLRVSLILISLVIGSCLLWKGFDSKEQKANSDLGTPPSIGINASASGGTSAQIIPPPKLSSLKQTSGPDDKISLQDLFSGFSLQEREGKIFSARLGRRSLSNLSGKNPSEKARRFLETLLKSQGLQNLQYETGAPSAVGDSAQYFFVQSFNGVPLYPTVGVSLLIEGSDDLVGMDADYVENLEVKDNRPDTIPGGQTLVIHHEEFNGRTKGIFAYREIKNGIETITNASNGAIILKRSRRDY